MNDKQESLFYESLYDALRTIVQQAGGAKKIGQMMWKTYPAERVGNKLTDCLNENRAEKLAPEEVMFLLKLGRQIGCHAGMNYLARDCGYEDPKPVSAEDQKERLLREFIEASRHMSKITEDLKALGIAL